MTDKVWHSRKREETLRAILDSLAEGVIVADKDGRVLFFNAVSERILGIGSKNVSPGDWTSVYGCYRPDKITPYPSDQLPLAQAIRGKEVANELMFIKNPNRPEGRYISVSASPLRDANGSLRGGTVIFRDVTERMQAEMKLGRSEERVKAQFRGFPVPTYVWQLLGNDFVLVDYNDAADAFTQGSVRSLLGIRHSAMYADSLDIQNDFLRCFKEKTSVTREMSYRLQTTGETKDLIVNYVFVPPDLVMVHTEDATGRKQNEQELRKLSNAVEQTADSVVITNKEGVIEYVNPAFEETTGYSRKEALGQTPRILKSGMHDRSFYRKLWRRILNGQAFRGTIVNKKKDGELYWCEQTITPIKDRDGSITDFVTVIKDITELRQKHEQESRLGIAREIQQRLLKPDISVPGFDIAGATYPAVETSGDYFDFVSLPDGCIGLVVGDVSGHGVGAALIMTQTRAYLRAFARTESDPATIMNLLNQELAADLDDNHFVTLILARLDPRKYVLDYASAGHVPAYLLDGSGKVDRTLESTGIPLGPMRDWEFHRSEPIKLAPDQMLVFFSDGIVEAFPYGKKEFGAARALEIINRHRQASSRQILDHLYQEVRRFSRNQPQQDDMTSIICKTVSPQSTIGQ
jgi:PAS domain S-box-containing protein